MGYKIITEPTQPVVPLDRVRRHLKFALDGSHPDDTDISSWLASACRHARHETERPIGDQVIELALDAFPEGAIRLPLSPVRTIASVQYREPLTGDLLTLDTSAYTLDSHSDPNFLLPAYGTDWPSTRDVANAVLITYTAGYGAALPDDVVTALLLLVGHYSRHREAAVATKLEALPLGVDSHLGSIKRWGM